MQDLNDKAVESLTIFFGKSYFITKESTTPEKITK